MASTSACRKYVLGRLRVKGLPARGNLAEDMEDPGFPSLTPLRAREVEFLHGEPACLVDATAVQVAFSQ